MDRAILKALHTLLISLGLAFVFNFLFFEKLVGISIFIITAILVGTVFVFGSSRKAIARIRTVDR